jgi:hypothetical protein
MKDELYEISLVFNEMAKKMKQDEIELSVTLSQATARRICAAEIITQPGKS